MGVMAELLTYEDYARLPDDGKRYELHDGVLSVTPAPGWTHQRVLFRLAVALNAHVRTSRLGEVVIAPLDVILSDFSVVQPDILFIGQDRAVGASRRGFEGAPTLAVEVISPSSPRIDRQTKRALYARHGVPYYWIVDPEARTIEVCRLTTEGYAEAERFQGDALDDIPPFPGLRLDPAAIWA
jgi:Uma2 family endonuclease